METRSLPKRYSPPAVFLAWSAAICALLAGLVLRLYALARLFEVDGDTLIYGSIAKNLLLHGRYALEGAGRELYPTLIRLPGYPFFLAACFRLFGIENYFAAACLQILLDLAACLLVADFLRRTAPPRLARPAALAALWLACLCPFTASFTAQPMAETPTLFAISLALWAVALFRQHPGWRPALLLTFALTFAALLRPDGALVALALVPAALLRLPRAALAPRRLLRIGLVCALLALTPFALWTARNWRIFHVVQPLAPRLATDPGEDPHLGWEAWIKSWTLDFASTYDIYWNVPDGPIDLAKLPDRAFDSPGQYRQTADLIADYNRRFLLTPEIDARFARLARQRALDHPLRAHLLLPLGRLADMWLRPRVENLPIDTDWWNYAAHRNETRFCLLWAALNLLYIGLALGGLCLRPRFGLALLVYMLMRSALLLTVEAPETRYTIECFPLLFALAAFALASAYDRLRAS